jgi:rabenosyn-5
MSRRTIGGGRVLGSGAGLSSAAPAPSPATTSTASKQPTTHVPSHIASPSSSSLSLSSTTTPTPTGGSSTPPSAATADPQDIASRISLDHGTASGRARAFSGATDRLVCPICNEEMMTLLQLNRHLDDAHKEIERDEQDEVTDWFKQQMIKAKKFQPLAVLNQKLKGLDVFESNYDVSRSNTPVPQHGGGSSVAGAATHRDGSGSAPPPVVQAPKKETIDPDDVVRKDHWQRRSGNDKCSDPTCGKRLGSTTTGIVNCRCCGKLFCEEHTMYQMKLSRSAQHEPVRGLWLRVCETCYKSREGYGDRHGLERDHTSAFKRMRQERIDKQTMEVSRLEKRLTRLTQLLANPPDEVAQASSKRWSLSWGQNDPRKALEQSVVSWQDDADVARCPYCQQDFSQYTFRRHHCRTCGKVVCGDPATGCSTILPLNVASRKPPSHLLSFAHVLIDLADRNSFPTEKHTAQSTVALDIRLCKDCNHTLFSQRDFAESMATPAITTFTRAYSNLLQFERGIRLLLPKFQKLLQALQDPEQPPTSTQIADASRTRKRLMDSFTQYDTAARRIRDMVSPSPTQLKLQKAIYQNASQFLHLHMLPLKTLPKILKHATPQPNGASSSAAQMASSPLANGQPQSQKPPGALASIHFNHMRHDSSSALSMSSVTSSRISELEAEEKSLRERLIVLEEQKFMVQEMIADANKRRKFDEVAALAGNVEDLAREIDEVQKLVDGVARGFEGVYAGDP